MTEHIIWAVIWFVLIFVSFYGGLILAGLTAFGSALGAVHSLTGQQAVRTGLSGVLGGVVLFVIGLGFAVFSLIKAILQIVAAFGAA